MSWWSICINRCIIGMYEILCIYKYIYTYINIPARMLLSIMAYIYTCWCGRRTDILLVFWVFTALVLAYIYLSIYLHFCIYIYNIYIYIYIHIYTYIYQYINMYIYEREDCNFSKGRLEIWLYIDISIYIYIYTYVQTQKVVICSSIMGQDVYVRVCVVFRYEVCVRCTPKMINPCV
jgi:hypothetical protein